MRSLFKSKSKKENIRIILGMVMLADELPLNKDAFYQDFIKNYSRKAKKITGDNSVSTITIDGQLVLIAHMPVPIPNSDIERTAEYAYNWETAVEDTKDHKSHLIVSITSGDASTIERFKIFTEVICSLLRTTNAIGVYKGNQSLLIQKESYLDIASHMDDETLPLYLWIYFGIRRNENGFSSYTYGLKEFNKLEMEIIESSKSPEEIQSFIYNMTHYVLDYDVSFKDGQTCGMSADERIPITLSKGVFVEGESFKLSY
ncbi:MAG: DUF4261 domain-containing protein [Sphingobacteriales bacterium]|nr:DUF4261 domain-containing protein [Sphingobacteriales bacterium]